jgi:hypothetical protein
LQKYIILKLLQYDKIFVFILISLLFSCDTTKNEEIKFFKPKSKVKFNHYNHYINNQFLNCMHNGDTLRKCNPEIREIIISKKFGDTLLFIMKDGSRNKAAYIVVNKDSIELSDLNNMTIKFFADGNFQFFAKQIGMINFFVKAKEQWKKNNPNDLQILPSLSNNYMLEGSYIYSKYDNFTFKLNQDTLFFTKDGKILNFYPYTAYFACCSQECFINSKANTVKILNEGYWRNYEIAWKNDSLILKELFSTYDNFTQKTYWNYTQKSLLLRKI